MTTERANDDRDDETFDPDIDRRTFIAAGGTVGATMLAGCAGDTTSDDSSDAPDEEETDGSTTADGANFRLLVSDRPADIGDFDRLDVSFDSARIFDGGGEDANDGEDTESETDGEDAEADGEETANDGAEEGSSDDGDDDASTADGSDDESDANDGGSDANGDESDASDDSDSSETDVERRRGFYWLDLEGATVDLTQVVGDKAISVFEGGLSAGSYEKIELHVADVEGVVDGETVPVKVPSEKLQIVHSFEVREDEPLEFVFDINVVKKGNGGYNLKPVISESGVAGEDIDVEEVDDESDDSDEDADGRGDAEEKDGDTGGSDGNETNDGDADDGTESEANP
ncbi:hypothetical protein Htur_0914 [Haloterrigena turkmenica DSM 5511]|uniref:DUF4382 domain-containing protein n=1 Tax=Haloterrigena turkmenica (strain ATCC 51198 / DSM 5511 / JCM 9101 / NCIMB 13204 / VKM B-1734 / 4k) TaxID=543526 RepID=D2RXX5_HALTV|nr:DUF4382 domain-containing protein [Haloterrigena turkmenica]ADB59809.1 hypothetical protein Htur_0914 [Haloterrigena turkmenica DSM 5511]